MPKGVYPHWHLVPKVYPADLVESVRRLYAAGASQAEVASQLGLTQKIVYRIMRNHGIARRPQVKRDQRGERNTAWKGTQAKYQALHVRVAVARGAPQGCEECGTTDPSKCYDWANLTGRYADVTDYRRLCRSCHWRMDGTIRNLKGAMSR